MKKKITELYELRFRTKEYRDSEGKLQRKREEYWGGRSVDVVSGGARFLHYLIDNLILFFISFAVGAVIGTANQLSPAPLQYSEGRLVLNVVGSFLSFGFYLFFEMATASTPGKMIFGRVVIDEYAEKPDAASIAIRSISRLVPFEAFSCLGDRGWHDRWSKTYVVTKAEARLLYDLRIEQEKIALQQMAEEYAKTRQQSSNPEPGNFNP